MKIIFEQVMTTTNLDSQGDKLTRDELQQIFDTMPAEVLIGIEHDASLPPMGRGFNKKMKQLDSGEWAIVMDVEVWDEQLLKGFGGFSVGFNRGRICTAYPGRPADLEIRLNPLHYPEEVFQDIVMMSTDSLNINTVEVKQRAEDPMAIAVLKFVSAAVAAGFFGQIGSEAFNLLRKTLADLPFRTKSGKRGAVHILTPFEKWDRTYQVVLVIDANSREDCDEQFVNLRTARQFIDEKIGDSSGIAKIIIKAMQEPPYWAVLSFVDTDGRVVEF